MLLLSPSKKCFHSHKICSRYETRALCTWSMRNTSELRVISLITDEQQQGFDSFFLINIFVDIYGHNICYHYGTWVSQTDEQIVGIWYSPFKWMNIDQVWDLSSEKNLPRLLLMIKGKDSWRGNFNFNCLVVVFCDQGIIWQRGQEGPATRMGLTGWKHECQKQNKLLAKEWSFSWWQD